MWLGSVRRVTVDEVANSLQISHASAYKIVHNISGFLKVYAIWAHKQVTVLHKHARTSANDIWIDVETLCIKVICALSCQNLILCGLRNTHIYMFIQQGTWGMFSGRMVTTADKFTISSAVVWILVNWIRNQSGLHSYSMLDLHATEFWEYWPDRTSSQWTCFIRKFSLAVQRQLRTEDSWFTQNPMWVQQCLHRMDRLFHRHQVKGTSMAHPPGTSRQSSHSWRHCQWSHWDWTPPKQYEQWGRFLF